MLHLGRLRALREVADRGTIAAAAQALHLTPSAVSQQISALEREVGERLVEPDGRGVRLTAVGRVLVRGADSVFAVVEALRAEVARHTDGGRADLRVGAFSTAIARIVAPAARELERTAPGIRLEVAEAESNHAFAELARHELDVVVSLEAPGAPTHDDPRAFRLPLVSDPLLAALPEDHPLAAAGEGAPAGDGEGADGGIPLTDLAREPWVAPPEGWLCETVIMAGCQSAGFTPHVRHRAGDWQAIRAVCGAGLGVGLIPGLAGLGDGDGAVVRPLRAPVPQRHVFAACRRGSERDPAVQALLEAMARAVTDRDAATPAASPP